jgi:hypothetical protein
VSSYQAKVSELYPYMGDRTRQMCRLMIPDFKVSEEVKRLFGVREK